METLTKEKFKLHHVMLYAKNWYKRSDIWEDLKKCLSADGYNGEFMDKYDIVHVITENSQRLPYHYEPGRIMDLINGIAPNNCWKYGYYTKNCSWIKDSDKFSEYDYYEAIVRYFLSNMVCINPTEAGIDLPKPDYKKVLPKKDKEKF